MNATAEKLRIPAFGTKHYGRRNKIEITEAATQNPEKQNENYRRARLRNQFTKKLQEIVLVDLQEEETHLAGRKSRKDDKYHAAMRERFLQESPNELKLDVARALREFSPIEQRILYRVYVQGMSVEIAVKRMSKSAMYWRQWLAVVALPKLQKSLGAYYEGGKVVL